MGFFKYPNSDNILGMSGHSKWANIKRQKSINDAKRSKIFSKLSRVITIAARTGGGDPASNPSLRLAVEKAKEARMPKENVDKAIRKGAGTDTGGSDYHEAVYEGYGPNGEAFYIKAITDNKNRTVAEIRNIFGKYGGSLGGAGSTAYIFIPDPENPIFEIEVLGEGQKDILIKLLEDLDEHDDIQDIYFNFDI